MLELFFTFLRLGFTSFGGPVAHIGYFHKEFVEQKKWFTEDQYAELVALSHFLPGPASSQVGMAIGFHRGGLLGSILAFLAFTSPSIILMIFAAVVVSQLTDTSYINGILHGMKLLAVAVVADAVWGMAKKICTTPFKQSITVVVALAILFLSGIGWLNAWSQLLLILMVAVISAVYLSKQTELNTIPTDQGKSLHQDGHLKGFSLICLAGFAGLLMFLPLFTGSDSAIYLQVFDAFFRSGGLVFGGGHVVLPMLQAEPVIANHVSPDQFLAAYSFAQAVPGPMFTIASYLGMAIEQDLSTAIPLALIATLGIFLPGWLILMATLSVWPLLKRNIYLASAMQGVVAATVGLLVAALYQPVFTSSVFTVMDMACVIAIWGLFNIAKLPVWAVVLLVSFTGAIFG